MGDETEERRPKRQKREKSYKAKAFEKFKQLKSGNKNKYEIEEIENVYETVDEKEYTKKVLERQDEDWIVDDDGNGYIEDGRDIFDDDLDQESIKAASSSKKGVKRKKKVAENAGRGNLHSLISNMPTKKKEDVKLDEDETLAELLQEINEDTTTPLKPKPVATFSPLSAKQAEKDYMSNFATNLRKPKIVVKTAQISKPQIQEIIESQVIIEATPEPSKVEPTPQPDINMDELDDLDMSEIPEPETEIEPVTQIEEEMLKDWNIDETISEAEIEVTSIDNQKSFKFFWWDAYEDSMKQPGVVFLFGKTYHKSSQSYISCCVVVRNIERRVFFLPRATIKHSDELVSLKDVYNEINDSVMKNLQIKNFKSRPICKKYAFSDNIPLESDYIEVRYSAKEPPISKELEGKTFQHVFGTETSYLEILLLDRKMKGPCWLEISNPVLVTNPLSWCKMEINCNKINDLTILKDVVEKPPLVVTAVNLRRTINPKKGNNEIVMLTCVTNLNYSLDRQAPSDNYFQKHFCVFTNPEQVILPFDLHTKMKNFKATTLQKMHSEKALLNYFINQLALLDPDLIVGHDLQGYQINVLSERLVQHQIANSSKLGRFKRNLLLRQKLERELFLGRLVCDVKISATELIRSRSYDLESLCQFVLKLQEQRIDFEPEEVAKMFQTSNDLFKLVGLTMQDTAYILRIMYNLNIIPLALQITNIAGNIMSKTLLGGRSERNEFLLLHAFNEKDYIVPDKSFTKKSFDKKSGRKKPTYSGGLVLDPKVGFYDKLILLMDFNSLYPSIIQEYNICFTTMPPELSEDNMVLPDRSLPPGILPTEIRKLVESRREVKRLMNNPDLSSDQKMQYHIRQMALKLTANSMYGCLGFSKSRFFAKNLAALITHKGREILTNTKDIVQRMSYEVIYGDTDSLMINTNIVDFDQVARIGNKIKQEINKSYKQIELEIDGVFKYLLLLKKKKYAAVTLTKSISGELKQEVEYKGLDIVRRDWSRIASEAGKFILNEIFSDQSSDDRVTHILAHLRKLKEDLEAGNVPLSLLVITKQLTKNPNLYNDVSTQSHVLVALRYNKDFGGHFRAGDVIPYVICDDGSNKSATQRAYHIEELKNSKDLKIDVQYYLTQQIHPVVSRICDPIEELDIYQISDCLGVDTSNLRRTEKNELQENITKPEFKFRSVDKFSFTCLACKTHNFVDGPVVNNISIFEICTNLQCKTRPIEYFYAILNHMIRTIHSYVLKYYLYDLYCEDPMCDNNPKALPLHFSGRFPICTNCKNSVLLKKFTESDVYNQLSYFYYIFDPNRLVKKPILHIHVERAYQEMKELIDRILNKCGYSTVRLRNLFTFFGETMERDVNEDGNKEDGYDFEDQEDSDEDGN